MNSGVVNLAGSLSKDLEEKKDLFLYDKEAVLTKRAEDRLPVMFMRRLLYFPMI